MVMAACQPHLELPSQQPSLSCGDDGLRKDNSDVGLPRAVSVFSELAAMVVFPKLAAAAAIPKLVAAVAAILRLAVKAVFLEFAATPALYQACGDGRLPSREAMASMRWGGKEYCR